jgi:hypothetical protein
MSEPRIPVDCTGITYNGRGCRKWKWLPLSEALQVQQTWRCPYHRKRADR